MSMMVGAHWAVELICPNETTTWHEALKRVIEIVLSYVFL